MLLHKPAISQHASQFNWFWQLLKSHDKTLKQYKIELAKIQTESHLSLTLLSV